MPLPEALGRLLPALDAALPTGLAGAVDDFLHQHAGASETVVLLVDYDEAVLRPLPRAPRMPVDGMPVDGTPAGDAYVTQRQLTETDGQGVVVHTPISQRGDRRGVLRCRFPSGADAGTLAGLSGVAVALAYVLPAAAHFTDGVERIRRERPMTLPAEMQWSLLPVRAYEGHDLTVAGQILPAYDVGGDLFDYEMDDERIRLCVTDAMGHGINASLLGHLAVAALRNGRRTGLSLEDQLSLADRVVHQQFGGDQFVTALVLDLDRRTGEAAYCSAGHPALVIQRGHGAPRHVDCDPQLPLGLMDRTDYRLDTLRLEPGDRLIAASDGVIEAVDADDTQFGEERLDGVLLATAATPAVEAVRLVLQQLRAYIPHEPRDDATVVMLDYRRPTPSPALSV